MAIRTIEVHESVFADNVKAADSLRSELTSKGITMFNVMSSPGSGKTTLLSALINRLKGEYRILDCDVDIETTLDATKVADATGVTSLQIHNGGLCHIDAEMTTKALTEFGYDHFDIVFLENIGNLVCPAEFDTGAHLNVCILSVPEGDDKPLKYPLMFKVCDLVIISKIDTASFFNFDFAKARENIYNLNKNARVISVSAKTGEGMDELSDFVREKVSETKVRAEH